MRKALAAALLIMLSSSVEAAIKYKFRQSTRTDIQSIPASETFGEVLIDGTQSRVDFPGKSFYGEDAYVISRDGSRRLYVVDPTKKTIAEVDVSAVAAALGSGKITISNLKSEVKKLPDSITIAGLPTEHYRIEMTYDVTMTISSMNLKQNVHTVIDKWTTEAFGPVGETFLAAGLPQTGNIQLDEIIAMESSRVRGLPLRQAVTITTTLPTDKKKATRSQLQVNPTRRQMTEMLVSEIKVVSVDPSVFAVPTTYRRLDGSVATAPAVHELQMQPANP